MFLSLQLQMWILTRTDRKYWCPLIPHHFAKGTIAILNHSFNPLGLLLLESDSVEWPVVATQSQNKWRSVPEVPLLQMNKRCGTWLGTIVLPHHHSSLSCTLIVHTKLLSISWMPKNLCLCWQEVPLSYFLWFHRLTQTMLWKSAASVLLPNPKTEQRESKRRDDSNCGSNPGHLCQGCDRATQNEIYG